MKICITCPHLNIHGGVSNYYNVIKKYLNVDVHFFQIGAQKNDENKLQKVSHLVTDIHRYRSHLVQSSSNYDLIHLNPSLDYKALIREGSFHLLSKLYGHRTLVLIHGWHLPTQEKISRYFLPLFRLFYSRADAFIVLAEAFRDTLLSWGIRKPIFVESTPVDDELIRGFELEKCLTRWNPNRKIQILFLARIIKEKGIFESIYAFSHLKPKYPALRLSIAGDGPHLNNSKKLVEQLGLTSAVEFLGHIQGELKRDTFATSDIYLFPTFHGEGMPTSVLEAMSFGLPLITCPIGGIRDFFEDGKHGFLAKTRDSHELASLIIKLLDSPSLFCRISRYNYRYAQNHFIASYITKRLEEIYSYIV